MPPLRVPFNPSLTHTHTLSLPLSSPLLSCPSIPLSLAIALVATTVIECSGFWLSAARLRSMAVEEAADYLAEVSLHCLRWSCWAHWLRPDLTSSPPPHRVNANKTGEFRASRGLVMYPEMGRLMGRSGPAAVCVLTTWLWLHIYGHTSQNQLCSVITASCYEWKHLTLQRITCCVCVYGNQRAWSRCRK